MLFSTNHAFLFIISFYMMTAMFYCNCGKDPCLKNPRTKTNGINFKLKDNVTGNDIIIPGSGREPVPDSIKLIDLHTGLPYPLFVAKSQDETIIFSNDYQQPANITDSLLFRFGSSTPDTLIVYTGIIEGWRGEECPSVMETGITKVVLRNQVLMETTFNISTFTLRK